MNTRQTDKWVWSLVLGLALPGVLRAQREEGAGVQPPPRPQTDEQSPADSGHTSRDAGATADPQASGEPPASLPGPSTELDTRRLVVQLRKLQSAMKERLDLNPTQQEAVDGLFATYRQSLRDYRGRRQASGPGGLAELKRLREEMRAATKTGDTETARRLRAQFRQTLRTRSTPAAPATSQFLKRLSAELDENQRKLFHAIARQLRIGTSPSMRNGLRRLWRTVIRPEVALTDRQRQTVVSIIRKGFASVAEARRTGDAGAVERAAGQVRGEVLAELTVVQRAKVLATEASGDRRTSGRYRDGPGAAEWEGEPVRTYPQPAPDERPPVEDRKDPRGETDPPKPVEPDEEKDEPPP